LELDGRAHLGQGQLTRFIPGGTPRDGLALWKFSTLIPLMSAQSFSIPTFPRD
jgi:hypothetical protein